MAKKTKRPFKKYLPDESLMPSMPNPGTRGAGGRIIKIRNGFQSVCDWGMIIDYHEAFGSLFRKYWPEIKKGKGSDYAYIYNLPQKVSQEIEKAYEIGIGFAKHIYEILGAVNDVIRFTTFKQYITYLEDELTVGDGYYQYNFKIFPKVRKMDENSKIECGAVTHMIVLFEQQDEMRNNLIEWVRRAKQNPAYTGKEGRPPRTRPAAIVLDKPISRKNQKGPPKKQGRPAKYTEEQLRRMKDAYDKLYSKDKDSKSVWKEVADNFGAPSGNAARIACGQLKKLK